MIRHGPSKGVPARSLNRLILIAVGRFGLPMPRGHGAARARPAQRSVAHGAAAGRAPRRRRLLVAPRGTTDWGSTCGRRAGAS